MARTWQKTNLKLIFKYTDSEFNEKTKSKSFSNVAQDSLDSDLFEVGASIASLQEYDLKEVQEIITNTISE